MTEYKIQSDFVTYLQLMYPDILYTISPAGFIMSAGSAMKMMRMGYTKGTPDLMIFEPRGDCHGLFIEFKALKGKVSESQTEFLQLARDRSYGTAVCYSTADAIKILEIYLTNDV